MGRLPQRPSIVVRYYLEREDGGEETAGPAIICQKNWRAPHPRIRLLKRGEMLLSHLPRIFYDNTETLLG